MLLKKLASAQPRSRPRSLGCRNALQYRVVETNERELAHSSLAEGGNPSQLTKSIGSFMLAGQKRNQHVADKKNNPNRHR